MRRWDGLESIPSGWERSVVAVGVFDGVHRGHRAIVGTAAELGRELGSSVVAVTFEPHPQAVLRGTGPSVLTPVDRRVELLGRSGADAVVVLPFTEELSALSPEEFARHVLVDHLHAAAVVVGEDFRFGHRAAGTVAALRDLGAEHGFTAHGVPLVSDDGGPVTSTRVRALLAEGDVAGAAELLGRPHRVEGHVVHGAARGRELLGFPTANMDLVPGTAVPGDGVYAGWMARLGAAPEEARWPAAISVGTNPTFDGAERTVEAYALDRDDLELYGVPVAVEFTVHIRGQERFDSVDERVHAMNRDVDRCRKVLVGG